MKNKIVCISFFAFVFVFSLLCIILPKAEFSESERRTLAKFPTVSSENIFSGNFSSGFEEYSTDVFPFRDAFREIKAYAASNIFKKLDNNKLFYKDGHLSKLEYPLNEKLLAHATERFSFIYETYLKDRAENIYLSVIPDKNYFLDTLKIDYEKLVDTVSGDMPWAKYIDIFPMLSIDDYYTTDSHWKQENLLPVADALLTAMGKDFDAKFEKATLSSPFFGVYSGQAAIKTAPDTVTYLTNDTLDGCIVKKYDSGKAEPAAMYDLSKDGSRDPYEMFLAGSSALLTIENPKNPDGGHLIAFRDSFGSSLLPLFAGEYSLITVVDIRYIPSAALGNFISEFDGADVLFLYSAGMLNQSGAMR